MKKPLSDSAQRVLVILQVGTYLWSALGSVGIGLARDGDWVAVLLALLYLGWLYVLAVFAPNARGFVQVLAVLITAGYLAAPLAEMDIHGLELLFYLFSAVMIRPSMCIGAVFPGGKLLPGAIISCAAVIGAAVLARWLDNRPVTQEDSVATAHN